jgi:hypothetical protein
MANTASHQQFDHALLTPGQHDSTHTIEAVPRTMSEAALALAARALDTTLGTSTAADVTDVRGTTTNTDHNSNNYQLVARPVVQNIRHIHQPAKAAPKTLCSCCECTTIAWIVFATIVICCAMICGFTGTVEVGFGGRRFAWVKVTPYNNKDEHVFQKPAQQRTIEDFLLDDIHALNEDCSSIDTLVTTILYKLPVLFGDAVHTLNPTVKERFVQTCTLEHTKRFTSNGLEICNGDNGNPLGYLIQCVYPDYYPRLGESPPATRTR